jgi:hypothetical protein
VISFLIFQNKEETFSFYVFIKEKLKMRKHKEEKSNLRAILPDIFSDN